MTISVEMNFHWNKLNTVLWTEQKQLVKEVAQQAFGHGSELLIRINKERERSLIVSFRHSHQYKGCI
jgi:hypothetical protein